MLYKKKFCSKILSGECTTPANSTKNNLEIFPPLEQKSNISLNLLEKDLKELFNQNRLS